jgi:hypothetical protein
MCITIHQPMCTDPFDRSHQHSYSSFQDIETVSCSSFKFPYLAVDIDDNRILCFCYCSPIDINIARSDLCRPTSRRPLFISSLPLISQPTFSLYPSTDPFPKMSPTEDGDLSTNVQLTSMVWISSHSWRRYVWYGSRFSEEVQWKKASINIVRDSV